MAGLVDFAPLTEDVDLGAGRKLTVSGLTFDDIFFLIRGFEEIRALLSRQITSIKPEQLMKSAPVTIGTIIACGTGERESKKAIEQAVRLSADAQLKTISVILRMTFPEGVGPFGQRLVELQQSFVGSAAPLTPDATGALGEASPEHLSAAVQMDEGSRKHFTPRQNSSRRGTNGQRATS